MNVILIFFALKYQGNWDLIYKALDTKEKVSLREISQLEEKMQKDWTKKNINVITLLDTDFPRKLKEAYKPPFVLFYKGEKELLQQNALYVGSDEIDANNKRESEDFKKHIVDFKTLNKVLITTNDEKLVSQAADITEIKKIRVVAGGINDLKVKEEGEVIISEYFGTSEIVPENHERKKQSERLIAAMSEDLVLLSSNAKKHLSLVSQFLNLGRDIYCFPKEASTENYNNKLLQQGATLLTSFKDPEFSKTNVQDQKAEQDLERELTS